MNKVKELKTTVYEYGNFYIDITNDGELLEAYLYHKDYGVKNLMFGACLEQFSYDEFVEMVESNLEYEPYICNYMKEFGD